MKREKKLTKRERKAVSGVGPSGKSTEPQHIHCVACGRHLDPSEFDAPATAVSVFCQHRSRFASCAACVPRTKELLAEHDRTGQAVKMAEAWH
jgi:methionyl-tRNA synthetase